MLNAFNPALGNAAVMDIGVYPLAVLAMLWGLPATVRASSTLLPNGFEGGGSAVLDYGDKIFTVSWSKITDSVTPTSLLGEGGGITVDKVSTPSEVWLWRRREAGERLPALEEENNMAFELADFLRLCAGETDTGCSYERYRCISLDTMRMLDRIRREAGIVFPNAPSAEK